MSDAQPINPPQKLEWLQVLRAVAALAVLLFHARPILPDWGVLQKVLGQGFFGVDIFFCLSGYVICATCERKAQSLGNGIRFIAERFSRIYLGYWPALLLTWALAWYGIRPITELSAKSMKSIFLLTVDMYSYWLEVAWSLAFEVRFYLIVFVAYFMLKLKISFSNIVLASLPLVLYGMWLYGFRFGQTTDNVLALREILSTLYLEFCFGVYAYKLNQSRQIRLNEVVYLAVPALLLVAAGSHDMVFAAHDLMRAGTYGLAALLILLIFIGIQNSGRKANKIMVAIGDGSYSLYLVHPLLLAVAFKMTETFPAAIKMSAPLLLIVITGLCYVWYALVEKRLYRAAKKIIHRSTSAGRSGAAPTES